MSLCSAARPRWAVLASIVLVTGLTACSGAGAPATVTTPTAGSSSSAAAPGGVDPGAADPGADDPGTQPTQTQSEQARYAVADPGPLDGPLLTPDLLIYSNRTLSPRIRQRVKRIGGVTAAMPLSVASAPVDGRTLTIGAVDPATYRRFTPVSAAQLEEIWQRVADGEVAVDPTLGKKLERPEGWLTVGNHQDAPQIHIGAYATMAPRLHAVVNVKRGRQLGMPARNALLVSTGSLTPSAITGRVERILDGRAAIQVLAREFDLDATQTAVLTGGSVAEAVGSFTYRPQADGSVVVDPSWVAGNITTEDVPILGRVTCHRVLMPQLRAAMQEIVDTGLSDSIHPGEYGGCYVPRFIASDPTQGLSLHTWGIAVDLNVPGNQRGTVGTISPQVVAILKKWGFAWGGDWGYTDPMHFELAALVEPQ